MKLLNTEIISNNKPGRVRLLLTMGEVFEEFNEQSFRLMDCSVANRYF